MIKTKINPITLAFGVVLSTATQLRLPGGLSAGPGEIILSLWVFINIFLGLKNMEIKIHGLAMRVIVFFVIVFLNLLLGTYFAINLGRILVDETVRYWVSLSLNLVILSLLLIRFSKRADFILDLIKYYVIFMAFLYTPVLIISYFSPNFAGLNLNDGRFNGLSLNPNQLATACLPIPYLILYIAKKAKSRQANLFYIYGFCILLVGYACYSDALIISWVVSIFAFFVFLWTSQLLKNSSYKIKSSTQKFFVLFLLPTIIAALSISAISFVNDRAYGSSDDDGNQSNVRESLWLHGIEAGAESPLFGLGLGAYSGIQGPFDNTEAHNTYIDWYTNTGFLGFAMLVYGCIYLGLISLKSKNIPILCLILSFYCYAFFHLILRQPTTWLVVAVIIFNALGT